MRIVLRNSEGTGGEEVMLAAMVGDSKPLPLSCGVNGCKSRLDFI